MAVMIVKRFVAMVLIMAAVSFILFAIFETDKIAVAGKVLGPYSSTEQREIWLEKNGYQRYATDLAKMLEDASSNK